MRLVPDMAMAMMIRMMISLVLVLMILDFVFAAAPVIDYDASLKDIKPLKAGTSLILLVNVIGIPTPSIKWFLNDSEVKPSADLTLEGDGSFSRLTAKKATGKSAGTYKVVAENEVGSDSALFTVVIKGGLRELLII